MRKGRQMNNGRNALPKQVKSVVCAPVNRRTHAHHTQQVPALRHTLLHGDVRRKARGEGHGNHEHDYVARDVVGRTRNFVFNRKIVDVKLHGRLGSKGGKGAVQGGEGGRQSVLNFAVVPQHHALFGAVAHVRDSKWTGKIKVLAITESIFVQLRLHGVYAAAAAAANS